MEKTLFPSRSGTFLPIANFLSALGGGTVLGQLIGFLKNTPYLKGDSLLAYLLGSTVALIILKVSTKKQRLSHFKKYSFISVATSTLMIFLIISYQDVINKGHSIAYLFFLILVFRFSFWFLARIIRIDIAAGSGAGLGWTEFAYSIGIILGLIIWPSWLTLVQILLIDIVALIFAGVLDNLSFKTLIISNTETDSQTSNSIPKNIFIGFAGFMVCTTIATQIVEFGFVSFSADFFEEGKKFGTNIVATAYFGAALGAWIVGKINPVYDSTTQHLGTGKIHVFKQSFPLIYICLISFLFLMLFFLVPFSQIKFSKELALISLVISTLFYELVFLVLLNKLGEIAKKYGDVGSTGSIYAYLGAIGSFFMLIFANLLKGSLMFVGTSFIFFTIAYLFLVINLRNK